MMRGAVGSSRGRTPSPRRVQDKPLVPAGCQPGFLVGWITGRPPGRSPSGQFAFPWGGWCRRSYGQIGRITLGSVFPAVVWKFLWRGASFTFGPTSWAPASRTTAALARNPITSRRGRRRWPVAWQQATKGGGSQGEVRQGGLGLLNMDNILQEKFSIRLSVKIARAARPPRAPRFQY